MSSSDEEHRTPNQSQPKSSPSGPSEPNAGDFHEPRRTAPETAEIHTDHHAADGRNTLPAIVFRKEQQYIDRRRRGASVAPDAPLVGLAISGGGIRSATFNLGIVQSLAKHDVLRLADYMSTVSGGGYLGSCISSLLTVQPDEGFDRRRQTTDPDHEPAKSPSWWKCHGEFAGKKSEALKNQPRFDLSDNFPLLMEDQLHHLRKHGDFLMLKQGVFRREFMRGIGTIIAGMMCTLSLYFILLVAVAGLFLAFTTYCTRTSLWQDLDQEHASTLKQIRPEEATRLILEPNLNSTRTEVTIKARPDALGPRNWPGISAVLKDFYFAPQKLGRQQQGVLLAVILCSIMGCSVGGIIAWWKVRHSRYAPRSGESIHDVRERDWLFIFFTFVVAFAFVALWYLWTSGITMPKLSGLLITPIYFATTTLLATAYYIFIGRKPNMWSRRDRSLAASVHGISFFGTLFFLLVAALVVAVWYFRSRGVGLTLTSLGALVVSRLAAPKTQAEESVEGKPKRTALGVGRQTILLVAVCLFVFATFVLTVHLLLAFVRFEFSWSYGGWIVFLVAMVALSVVGILADFNRIGPHYFYRDRLTETYLQTTAKPVEGKFRGSQIVVRDDGNLKLCDLHAFRDQDNPSPYHLILCSLNLAGSEDLARKDRKSDHFIFSREYCGSTTTGYVRTSDYRLGSTNLAQAMTISGAAAASGMGFYTSFAQAFALTVFNVRLGYWVTNPRVLDNQIGPDGEPIVVYPEHTRPPQVWVDESWENGWVARRLANWGEQIVFWPLFLLREMLAITNTHNSLVNISDGGHTGDNIGLYPLLQRRCRLIIGLDGGAEPNYDFGSLAHAIRQINIDENVEIQVCLGKVRPLTRGEPAAGHVLVGKISYPANPAGAPLEDEHQRGKATEGWIILVKLSLTAPTPTEPAVVRSYADNSESFPHESTGDQFFTDDQFEAYRALGAAIADEMVTNMKTDVPTDAQADVPTNGLDADQIIAWCEREYNSTGN